MITSEKLMYFDPDYVRAFIAEHPCYNPQGTAHLRHRGGPGDVIDQTTGKPPPAVQQFLRSLRQRGKLFTCHEYVGDCQCEWRHLWARQFTSLQARAFELRLYVNFYMSMIDQLHAWGLISREGWFDSCALDAVEDAIGKVDLTLTGHLSVVRVALEIDTPWARADSQHKLKYRDAPMDADSIVRIRLPYNGRDKTGNKRWFTVDDFRAPLRPYYDPFWDE